MAKKVKKIIIILCTILILGFVAIAGTFTWHVYRQTKQVNALDQTVNVIAQNEGMTKYLPYIKAIIFTESAGSGIDVMQASESKYGVQDGMASQGESIDAGITFLKKAIQKANKNGCDIWTAIQAYNFGLNYIDYVAKHGKKNSIQLAEEYSKNYLAEKDSAGQSETYRYLHLDAILYNGGYLYKNGGNFFYADKVKHNMEVMEWVEKYFLKNN